MKLYLSQPYSRLSVESSTSNLPAVVSYEARRKDRDLLDESRRVAEEESSRDLVTEVRMCFWTYLIFTIFRQKVWMKLLKE